MLCLRFSMNTPALGRRTILVLSFLLLLVTVPQSQAIEWSVIGSDTLDVTDYLAVNFVDATDMLLTRDGIYVGYGDIWTHYDDVALPAIDAIRLDFNEALVIFGDGSFSDGIYEFNYGNGDFTILDWVMIPNFIHQSTEGYYVGYESGLRYSADLETWADIAYFNDMKVVAMSSYGQNMLVTVADDENYGVHTSSDGGQAWSGTGVNSQPFSALHYDAGSESYYGVLGGDSRSSGLWSSADFGVNWNVAFYSMGMVSIVPGYEDFLLAWDGITTETGGVFTYDPNENLLLSLNEGLPCLKVNKLSINDMVDCVNVVACTDSGAYFTCDLMSPQTLNTTTASPQSFELDVYPNPFNASTVVQFVLPETGTARVSLFNMTGREVLQLHDGVLERGSHTLAVDGASLASGVYLLRASSGSLASTRKLILLK